LGDQLSEPQPPRRRGARAAGVLVDDGDRLARPAQLDGALGQRILARRRLDVALHLTQRRLAHIDDRAPTPVHLGDLRAVTHRARPRPAARATAPTPPPAAAGARPAASPTPPPPRSARSSRTRAVPPREPPFSAEAAPRRGRRARS